LFFSGTFLGKPAKNTPIPSSHELSVFSATEHPNFKSESPKFHSLLLAELGSFQNKPYLHIGTTLAIAFDMLAKSFSI